MQKSPIPRIDKHSLGKIGEFGFIQKIQKRFGSIRPPIIHGIGDDSAILRQPSGQDLLVSTDLLVEDIHFNLSFHRLQDIGYRAAVANLSDIAAMGGTPQALLIGIAISPNLSPQDLMTLYDGLMDPCKEYEVTLMGGDTSASLSRLFLSITMFGTIKQGQGLKRSGAKVSDHIYVTGSLGDSLAGLQILKNRSQSRWPFKGKGPKWATALTTRHLRPTPRLEIGKLLVASKLAHSAIDLSDGLSGDLMHLCEASQVGAELWEQHIPISAECRKFAIYHGEHPRELAMQGGEDYELLFTAPANQRLKIQAISRSCGIRISCIGKIRSKKYGVRLKLEDGASRKVNVSSYHHFMNTPSRP